MIRVSLNMHESCRSQIDLCLWLILVKSRVQTNSSGECRPVTQCHCDLRCASARKHAAQYHVSGSLEAISLCAWGRVLICHIVSHTIHMIYERCVSARSTIPRQWKSGSYVSVCLGASADLSHWKDVVDLYCRSMTIAEVSVRLQTHLPKNETCVQIHKRHSHKHTRGAEPSYSPSDKR